MKVCGACGAQFAGRVLIDGSLRNLSSRRFCLRCSPFGSHNASSRPLEDPGVRRRRSWASDGRSRRVRIKAELVESRGGRCLDCGYKDTIEALEFHHRDQTDKQFALGGFHGSIVRAREEAAKCILVCGNCHRARHSSIVTDSGHAVVRFRQRLKARSVATMGGACAGCGLREPMAALQFHHRDPQTKEFGISTDGIPRRWTAIEAELAKCVLLCVNCHREVQAGARQLGEDQGPYACEDTADLLHRTCA